MVMAEKRRKWDKNSKEMVFIGYDESTKGYRCSDPNTRSIVISRNVKFLESSEAVRDSSKSSLTEMLQYEEDDDVGVAADAETDSEEIEPEPKPEQPDPELEQEPIVPASTPAPIIDPIPGSSGAKETPEGKIRGPEPMTTRSKSRLGLPFAWGNLVVNDLEFALKCDVQDAITDPTSVENLRGRPDEAHWRDAMRDEYKSLIENKTWRMADLPKGKKTVKSKWVFKTKRGSEGEIVRYKARLVAKGFTQRYGVDYTETYAPVVRYTSVRLLMAVAAAKGLKVHQMDAVTAFLQGDVDEEIYMEQPEGFDDGTGRVCRLNRSIYGLKQAGRQWHKKLDAGLQRMGLRQSEMDPCIYYADGLMIGIYVDDFIIIYKDEKTLDKLKSSLMETFKMKDMGPAKQCIGIRIQQLEGEIQLDQSLYIEEVLKKFGMWDCKPIGNPTDTNAKLTKPDEKEVLGDQSVPYQEAVGCLLFIAQATRPDIAFAVSDVSRFNHCHGPAHWKAVKRIMRYLKGTIDLKLTYKTKGKLLGYSDADWASDTDTRKSVTGYVYMTSGGAIVWRSTRQDCVALSSTEAEYIAAGATTQEALWLRQLCRELGLIGTEPMPILCDNQSAIKLALNTAYQPRTKHIDIRHHFLRQHLKKKDITIDYVNTEKNLADVLTKAVTKAKLDYCSQHMGLTHAGSGSTK